jgi:hypothetical protein
MGTPKGTVPWNAGTGKGWTDKRGYRWIYVIENGRRRAKREHRHIMEQHLARQLAPEELVHHRNGNTSDNRIENLELVAWGEHTTIHHNGTRHHEYSKQTQSVIAEYREENKRLRLLNADMLGALRLINKITSPGTRTLDDFIRDMGWACDEARRVIAKAEGRS